MQQQFVGVHFFDQLFAAIVFQVTQRAPRGDPAGRKQRIKRRGKRTDVVSSRLSDFSHHVHANGSQTRKRNIRRNIAELGAQHLLHRFLNLSQSPPAHQQRSGFRQIDPALAIHRRTILCETPPQRLMDSRRPGPTT